VSAPGWYPDPAGQPGLFRYWDGRAWSAATTPNPLTLPPQTPGTPLPPSGPSAYAPTAHATYTQGKRRPAVGWIIAVAAVLVVAVVVVVLVVRNLGGTTPIADPSPGAPASANVCPEAVQPSGSPAPQTGDRVASGQLSYPRLATPFGDPYWDSRVPFGRDVQSQQATVEADPQGEPTWVAAVLIARLLAGDGFYGPEQGAKVVATCVTGKFYGNAAVTRQDSRNEAIQVDGRSAWTIEAQLTFQLPDIQTTGETMIIVVVDTGNGEAGLYYASIPDSSPQFMAPARQALAGLEVAG
jgi:hypothetical protein